LQQGKKKNHKITYLQHQIPKYASRFSASFLVGYRTAAGSNGRVENH
jgi:hypothetical protein